MQEEGLYFFFQTLTLPLAPTLAPTLALTLALAIRFSLLTPAGHPSPPDPAALLPQGQSIRWVASAAPYLCCRE